MKSRVMLVALLTVFGAASAWAAEGVPSQSKLNKLGLGSMEMVSDQAGQQVRGSNFVKVVFRWQTVAGEKAVFDGTNLTIDPANFVANDMNQGSGITADGVPLVPGIALPQAVNVQANSAHQQSILGNNFNFSEISASSTVATVLAGNANLLGIIVTP